MIDTAYEEGKLEGRLEGSLEEKLAIAKSLKESGVDISIIMKTTGLTKEQIDAI